MYYLVDTTLNNGCLRVLPGSHIKRHKLHEYIPEYEENIKQFDRFEKHDHPLFQHASGEVNVTVKAGDLVIGDARLFHSAHKNQSGKRRTVLTLWFWPNFNEMPESLRALLGRETDNFLNRKDRNVWNESWPHELTEELLMKYNGNMKPLERSRYPSNELK